MKFLNKKIISIGRLVKQKNHKLLIEAFDNDSNLGITSGLIMNSNKSCKIASKK